MTNANEEQKLREDMCRILGMMYNRGYIGGPAGNISARLGEDRYLLSPSIHFKQFLKPDQLIIVNGKGEKVGHETEANKDLLPTSELPMHLAAYNLREDVNAVVHAHPSHCVALTVAGREVRSQVLTEGMLFLGKIAHARYATPTTAELGEAVAEVVVDHDVIVFPYHGAMTIGHDMWDAYAKMELLEQVAQINCLANQIGGEKPLAKKHIEGMMVLRRKMNMNMPSDDQLNLPDS